MDACSPRSRQELEAELACLKSRLREYEAKEALNFETGEAVRDALFGFESCQERLKAKDHQLCDAQRNLHQALDRYATLFSNSPTGYFLLDRLGIVHDANPRGAALLDSQPDLLTGKPFAAHIAPLDRADLEHNLALAFQGRVSQAELRTAGAASGAVLSLHMAPMDGLDKNQEPLCLVSALDLSAYRAAEKELAERTEQLARSNEDLERFAYVISHDLQEPLRNIGNYVQMLARKYKGRLDEDADLFIGFVTEGVARLSSMIREILSFSRITTQGREPEPVDSGAALKDALANLESLIEETGAEICIEAMPAVLADRIQLVSLFQNLIGNALKYQAPARKPGIRIQARPAGETWMFSVADNGIGIESRQFERLFTLFQRGDPKGSVPGSGIGLAVCKRIVERHGGQIWVESTPGQGSVFYFTLSSAPPA